MKILVGLLVLAFAYFLHRLRRLARRVEDLQDRLIQQRLDLARRQDELAARLGVDLASGSSVAGGDPASPSPSAPLIQIRTPPRAGTAAGDERQAAR